MRNGSSSTVVAVNAQEGLTADPVTLRRRAHPICAPQSVGVNSAKDSEDFHEEDDRQVDGDEEILDRADIGRSTFYAHFKGKDELLILGIHELRDTLESAMQAGRLLLNRQEAVVGFSLPNLHLTYCGSVGRA